MTDAVDRLTPLGLMILALLREDDMHPYEMIRLMRQRRDDRIVAVTNGTMYHTVARLERCGLLAEVGVDRDGNRPERTTYTLTDAGRTAVVQWVHRELPLLDRPAQFRVALAEAHNLPREEVVARLRERVAAITAEHAMRRDEREKGLAAGVPDQYLIELERDAVLLGSELTWLRTLIERVADTEYPWGEATGIRSDRYLAQREAARR